MDSVVGFLIRLNMFDIKYLLKQDGLVNYGQDSIKSTVNYVSRLIRYSLFCLEISDIYRYGFLGKFILQYIKESYRRFSLF